MRYAILGMLAALVLMAGMPSWFMGAPQEMSGNSLQSPTDGSRSELRDTAPSDETQEPPAESAETAPSDPTPPVPKETTVKLLRHETGAVESIDLEEYLCGVVFGEMPASFGLESLRAQAVAARTYTMYQIKHDTVHENADLCDDSACCQCYLPYDVAVSTWSESLVQSSWELIRQAVNDTAGQILTSNGEPIAALYHAASYGMTEAPSYVWGGELPCLVSVESPEEDILSTVEVSADRLGSVLTDGGYTVSGSPDTWLGETTLTPSGRVKAVSICGQSVSGVWLRSRLALKSAMYSVRLQNGTFVFTVHGSGHGVGMSQYGAKAYAEQGWSYDRILAHYYPNVTLDVIR